MEASEDPRLAMTVPVDAAATSADAERHRAQLDAQLVRLEVMTSMTFPPGWQREAHRWSADLHRAAADAHTRAAGQHTLEVSARRRHPIR